MKCCARCKQEKPINEFRLINRKVGQCLMSYCSPCEKEAKKEYKKRYMQTDKGKEQAAEYQRRYQKRIRELAALGKQVLEQRKTV